MVDINALRPNIMFLWRFDNAWTNIELFLSVPREGGSIRRSVKDHYTVPVPHPIARITPQTQLSNELGEELDITLKETIEAVQNDNLRGKDTAS
mgnify:CR=1 FL=1